MNVVILGAGPAGLSAGTLLAKDGHRVTVLERDPAQPPAEPASAWSSWERRGVNQFRMAHAFLPRFRQTAERELPELLTAIEAAGGLRYNPLRMMPASISRGERDGDERFEMCTGRRPVVEAALAQVAAGVDGLTVRRGCAVRGVMLTDSGRVPHVAGVVTDDSELTRADLVVDAMGRRSPMLAWLRAADVHPPVDEVDDVGFVYYARHYRSADSTQPALLGPLAQHYGSMSIITLPADNGTWSVVIVASSRDALMREARHVDTWESIVRSHPLAAHWIAAEPLGGIEVMAKIEDRRRSLCTAGKPVVSGVALLGDSWGCTNPSVGRGASLALMHAVELRDLLRHDVTADPVEVAERWEQRTDASVGPYFHDTRAFDRHRLAQIEAHLAGQAYAPADPGWNLGQALAGAAPRDPDLLRHFLEIAGVLARGVDVLRRPGVAARATELADPTPLPGPGRGELEAILAGAAVAA